MKSSILNQYNNHLNNRISDSRGPLMGFAMLWIFFTHALSEKLGFNPPGVVGQIFSYGYLGVDIFLFLSAYGLSFSLERNKIRTFYKRRIQRILPIWLIVLVLVHFIGFFVSKTMPELDFKYPKSIEDLFFWYTGLGFWFNRCCYEWYIPSILFFYLISPYIYKLNIKKLSVLIAFIYLMLYLVDVPADYQYLNIFLQRVPIFFIGFLYYKMEWNNELLKFNIGSLCIGVLVLLVCPHESAVLNFTFVCPLFCLLLSWPMQSKLASVSFAALGSISLEFYLIHLFKRPQFFFSLFIDNPTIQVFAAFILCCVGALVLHTIADRLSISLDKIR